MYTKGVKRNGYLDQIHHAFKTHPVIGLLGPRQCGKTTLAQQFRRWHPGPCHLFDLEDPEDLAALDHPKPLFESLSGTIIIDEIQRRPDLFPYLRVLVDREKRKRKILLLGSASRELIQQGSESLAGRICYLELTPFVQHELKGKELPKLWQRGGFPRSFLAPSHEQSFAWRKSYISTFLERDLPALGIRIPSQTLSRFWKMIAHYHGQTMNYSELGRSFGIADTTVRKYTDILTGTFMIRQLQPWHENIKKRQVKAPKIYLRDSGLFHSLLTIKNHRQLLSHPKLGASWEGFALEQVIQMLQLESSEVFFWSVHGQGEIDLLFTLNGKRYGIEFKFAQAPELSHSMLFAQKELQLHQVFCLYQGSQWFSLAPQVYACGLSSLHRLAQELA